MKFSKILASTTCLVQLLVCIPTVQAAKKCGTWATEDCIGDIDKRYDPDVSTNLEDLHPLYKLAEGYWVGTFNTYGPDLQIQKPTAAGPQPFPYPKENVIGFLNITLSGSRFYQHDLYVHAPADADFCNNSPASSNVLDDGVCGFNGYADAGEAFRTSTHEVDEVSVDVFGTGRYIFDPETFMAYARPLEDQVLYTAVLEEDTILVTTTYTFSKDHSSMALTQLVYRFIGTQILAVGEVKGTVKKTSKDDFLNQIDAAYTNNKVTPSTVEKYVFPIELGGCLAPPCPKEEDWARSDPNMSESPYQERYKVKTSVVAGFTSIAALLLLAAVVAYYQWRIRQIEKAAKHKFAARLRQSNIDLVDGHGNSQAISPKDLIDSFNRIDDGTEEGGDGLISKDELWAYITKHKDDDIVKKQDGEEMTKKEFDALFANVDKDGSNAIDFSEYCAFIAELNREE